MVGLVVGAAVVMAVLIAGPGALAKFRACKATDSTGAQLTCLSANQAVQAQEAARTTAAQGLGVVAVLAGALTAATVGWRQVRSTAALARAERDHDWELAAAERQQQRKGETYPDMLRTAIMSLEWLRLEVDKTRSLVAKDITGAVVLSPELAGAPGPADLIAMDARVQAFGSPEMADAFTKFLREGARVHRDLTTWNDDQTRRPAMTEQALAHRQAGLAPEVVPLPQRPSVNDLEELNEDLIRRARTELSSRQPEPKQ